jgi:rhodanese-related sulfurtransferase
MARELSAAGYAGVYALKGGWREWAAAGFPDEPK